MRTQVCDQVPQHELLEFAVRHPVRTRAWGPAGASRAVRDEGRLLVAKTA